MKYKIIKDINLSGRKYSIYSIFVEEYGRTLFEKFVEDNFPNYPDDIQTILDRLEVIAHEVGARKSFFKEYEGKPGDLVCALYDTPGRRFRLYCIRYGTMLIVLGSGGLKNVSTWQEDPNIREAAEWMIKVSGDIYQRQKDKEIWFANDDMDMEGDLKFGYDEER
ncbi:MAG: hypothetical protein IPJ40_11815 [Saprospirales bacterium]|nr:hypothetical protein [Saprospirales bacterium]